LLLSSGASIDPDSLILSADMGGHSRPAPVVSAPVLSAAEALAAQPAAASPAVPVADGAPPQSLVGRTVAEVERDLIIDTVSHCLGNRTHAATILGISIRTLRNKLKQYTDEGHPVPPPAAGEPSDKVAS
jgi:DNA-binding NtrC family response regulator